MENFDKRKMLEVLTDPKTIEVLAELEDGEKDKDYLSKKLQLSENEIRERLSYPIEHGFVIVSQDNGNTAFRVDSDKLNEIMESDGTFDSVIDGLTELDQFLN